MNEPFSLVDLLDAQSLPLKNRVGKDGYYAPGSNGNGASCGTTPAPETRESLIPTEPLKEGEQYRFHFDMARCIGCQCCVVACNEQNNNPASVNWRRVGEIEGGVYPSTKRHHLSMACNHCLDPSCLTGCPTGAYVKDEKTGIVMQESDECIGCQYCTWNCPYGVPQFNPERRIVTKCDMCHGRLSQGQVPACAAACPEQAIRIEKVSASEWRENHAEADAPGIPESGITLSTTRITLPREMPSEVFRANRHWVEPEKPHASLVFMTVLTQLAVGGFLALWLGDLFSGIFTFLRPLQDFLAFGSSGILAVTGLALFASVFHLGRPLYAYKALRMWRRSWLSREVLFFTLFSFLGAGYAGLLLAASAWDWPVSHGARSLFGGLVGLAGAAGIYSSAKIYLVPARPAWNTYRTPLRFFLTGFILGPLFSLMVYAGYLLVRRQPPSQNLGPVFAWLLVSSAAAALQLFALLGRLSHLGNKKAVELYDSAMLLIRRFRAHFLVRIGLMIVGSFLLPLYLLVCWGRAPGFGAFSLLGFTGACFLLALLGEFLGRYLFFVTVVPKNIPGSFFTRNGGSH
ncbi:MAG: dimethyl sulfoxide reductase anchor subunit [Candidatus Omnitrophica bacterium]|nr:dimethyl sulfoxide reductase anchor subunit [Candidatus Omnitrophota bacterium]